MNDIPLTEAQIIWDSDRDEDGPRIKVVGGSVPDDSNYSGSWGSCNAEFNEADDREKLALLLARFVEITLHDGLTPKQVFDAFCVIPEFRNKMAEASGYGILPNRYQRDYEA